MRGQIVAERGAMGDGAVIVGASPLLRGWSGGRCESSGEDILMLLDSGVG